MMAELAPPWGKFSHPSGQVRQRNCPGASSAFGHVLHLAIFGM